MSQASAAEQYTKVSEDEKGIRTIQLNDPKKRNALSLKMLKTLHNNLTSGVDDLRAIILCSTGPVWSAGHDLKELDLPIPVIASVSGLATAAGAQLVASCDIAIAAQSARFATPGVSVGLFCSTPAVAVGRAVPRKVAMEMLFTGHPITAQDALLHGLVSRVVPDHQLEEETQKIADRICETSREVVAIGKATFYAQMNLERKEAYRLTSAVMVENLSLEDGQEGIKAFIEKRKPTWSHRNQKVH
uniref:Enoyl-CoA hydratase domain-containing protein 3, mitochondrial n=1 Tax=Magallana gigas TaxID=29159 RepID=K1RYF2_MAGGI